MSTIVDVELLGGFHCRHAGERVALPLGAQRLVALLAMHSDGLLRSSAGERLWPDSTRSRAAANLRSALWRCTQIADGLIDRTRPRLRLAPAVSIDLHEVTQRVHGGGAAVNGWERMVKALSRDLLPDWSDDWLVFERERWHQLRLHALEDLVQDLMRRQQYPLALQTALLATSIEPTRETAHRLVIQAHLAEGNSATAVQHYQRYRGMLGRELGITPSHRMTQLIRPLLTP